MNRYPLWKNILIIAVLFWGLLYTLPNFFGEAHIVQISSAKPALKIDPDADSARIDRALEAANATRAPGAEKIEHKGISFDATGIRVRFAKIDDQSRAKEIIENEFNPDKQDPSYIVAVNLLPNSPQWLTTIRALPMYLGLDLRGGVHFLLKVDMPGAISRRMEAIAGELRVQLRDKDVRARVTREGDIVMVHILDAAKRATARSVILSSNNELQLAERDMGSGDFRFIVSLEESAKKTIQEFAITQNINTLHNRINELGVAEPVIQRQGAERIVVQLPGVQDVTTAKEILGRTATLELRMVEGKPGNERSFAVAAGREPPPRGTELHFERRHSRAQTAEDVDDMGLPMLLREEVELTGENLTDARAGFDENNQPAVHLTLDGAGSRKFRELTRHNIGNHMAILLVEKDKDGKDKAEIVTAPVIRDEIGGGRVQISGSMTSSEANKTALLLRAGALATSMEIIEERTVGPSSGAENIKKGKESTLGGFIAIVVFMSVYYMFFGLVSSIALSCNLLLLVALLSLLQATLTLPGIAAMALTLGMAIDSNVLINERIREELRNGYTPQAAISAGYERAWSTILDSNVTTLIVAFALLIFGSGPIRGFAVVHCLGILTSMFSAILVSRMIINFIYGRRRKLDKLSIGQIWKPDAN
ncbi:MAG: protein translocase subunit SecD [Azoarcus sp.]|jgi:preprotein translocase subunit SecD|nr:protein translocase subunit SecD [Azoarcus sp.]